MQEVIDVLFTLLGRIILAMMMTIPSLATTVETDEAGALYHRYCSVCHGDQGDGKSRARYGLTPPPKDFTNPEVAAALTRKAMIQAVLEGVPGTAMVAWKTQLTATQAEAIVDFIRTRFMALSTANESVNSALPAPANSAHEAIMAVGLTPRQTTPTDSADMSLKMPKGLAGNLAKGAGLYHSTCFTCHGNSGDGNGPRAYFIQPRPRNFLAPAVRRVLNRPNLFYAIKYGVRGREMPAWRKVLSDQEIADVTEYVFQTFIRSESVP